MLWLELSDLGLSFMALFGLVMAMRKSGIFRCVGDDSANYIARGDLPLL